MESLQLHNFRVALDSPQYQKSLIELVEVQKFIADMGYLSLGRDYVMCHDKVFSLQIVMISAELTLGNIYNCCEYACFSDANTLVRKYRDDLFFYLYLTVFHARKMFEEQDKTLDQMERNIEAWLGNNLSSLHIGDVLKAIASMKKIKAASQKYNMQNSLDNIAGRLNNFVHSNGFSFYNKNALVYQNGALEKELSQVLCDLKYITTTFVFLLILCAPRMVMSSDYIDYLESQETPPKGSQYWVAPFIEKFLHDNTSCIDNSCLKYLRENTPMQF